MAKFTILMSACLSTLTESQNAQRTAALHRELKRHSFDIVSCEGVYKGVKEASFAVPVNYHFVIRALSEIAREYEQESILVVDNESKEAHLIELDDCIDVKVAIGKWTKTTWNDCKYNHDNYTYFPEANVYYVCRP